jgi:hypothetical protein
VARVVGLDRVETPLRLPAAARTSLMLGDPVTLSTTSEHRIACEATITRLSPVDDPQTRTVTAYVVVDQRRLTSAFGAADGTRLLLPGMFVSGVVTSQHEQARWIVPRRSVRGGRLQLVRDGRLVSREVTVDFVIEGEQPEFGLPDRQWAVLEGRGEPLQEGELVLVEGSATLLDGQAVEPVHVAETVTSDERESIERQSSSRLPSPRPSPAPGKGEGGQS